MEPPNAKHKHKAGIELEKGNNHPTSNKTGKKKGLSMFAKSQQEE